MKILVSEKISQHKYKTPEGYLVCVDSVLARTGKQEYRRNEVFSDAESDEMIEVDRRPEEVFSDATLASFENKPICIEHPDEDVNVHNHRDLAVGFARDIKRGVDNGQDVMLGTLVVTDEEAIRQIEEGNLPELSCGYDCDIIDEENPQQRNIRGNHIALCERGRAGIARIVDSVKDDFYGNVREDVLRKSKDFKLKTLFAELDKLFIGKTDIDKENRIAEVKSEITARVKQLKHLPNDIFDSVNDSKFTVGWVRRSTDRSEYTSIEADSCEDAKAKLKKIYGREVYHIFSCSLDDSMNDAITNSELTKYNDLLRQALDDEVTAINIYDQILNNADTPEEVRAQIQEIENDEKDHYKILADLVADNAENELKGFGDNMNDSKVYRIIVNGIDRDVTWEANSPEEAVKEFLEYNPQYRNKGHVEARLNDSVKDGKYVNELKLGDIITMKDGSKWRVTNIRSTPFGIQVRMDSIERPVKTREITYNPTDMLAFDSFEVNDALDSISLSEKAKKLKSMYNIGSFMKNLSDRYNRDINDTIDEALNWIASGTPANNATHKLHILINSYENLLTHVDKVDKEYGILKDLLPRAKQAERKLLSIKVTDSFEVNDRLVELETADIAKIEQAFKSDKIFVKAKGKTWTGNVHYQLEYGGSARELKNKLDVLSNTLDRLGIPMTYAINSNDDDTFATAGVDFLKKSVKDSKKDALSIVKMIRSLKKDATDTYEIHWIDTYSRSKGWAKEFWSHKDMIKANSYHEALEKLASKVPLSGVGMAYVLIVSMRNSSSTYQQSGRLLEMLKTVKE